MVSKTLLENLTKSFSCNKMKKQKRIKGKMSTSSIQRIFILTTHARLRMKERGATIDKTKLKVTTKPRSNYFDTEIKKAKSTTERTYIYWTDGFFTFVTTSEKAGVYIVITVV